RSVIEPPIRRAVASTPCELCHSTFSWQVPRSYRLLHLLECRHIRSQSLAIGQLSRPVAALSIQKIQQAGGASLVGVLADVARVLRLFQIFRGIQLDDLVVAAQGLV